MKKIILLIFIISSHTLMAQNVGIGTSIPLQKLHVEGTTYLNGNVGIGNATPAFPLSFAPALGDKISLWSNSTNSYGFGIQGSLLQIHTDIPAADIAFGYGSSVAFTEVMRIKGNGNIGIGLSTPTAKLSISANGTELTGTALGNTFTTNAGILGSTPGSQLSLANIGFLSSNNSSLGIRAHRNSAGTDWMSTALLFGYDVDNTVSAGGFLALAANGNIGIGTSSPFFPLTFKDDLGEKISLYGNANSNYGIGVQAGTLQIHSDAVGADIAFGVRSGGSFTENMRIKGNGNTGIGTTNPLAKLQVSAGDVSLALFGPNSYGGQLYVGAANNQATLLTAQVIATDGNLHLDPAPGKNMYLGYFQPRDIYMNSSGGNVGIGNSNPTYQLDISNRMRIRSGGNNSVSAGLWLNNNANNLATFIGMEDDTHVGFFGIGTGWKFGMNTQNGALKINGSEGTSGQVLVSNGSSAAAGYTTIGNVLVTDMRVGSGSIDMLSIGSEYLLPQLSHTITLTRRSRLIISGNTSFQQVICIGCTDAKGELRLKINGSIFTSQLYSVAASSFGNASICNYMPVLEAGTYTIDFYIYFGGGPQHFAYPKYSSFIILPVD